MLIHKLLRRFMDEAGGAEDGGAGAGEVSPAGAAEPAEASTEADVNWAGMAEDLDAEDAGEDQGEVEGDAEIVGETPPVATPAVETPPVTPPAAETPPVTPPTETPPTPPVTPPTPETPAPDYAAWRTERLGQLEQQYALNEADAAALLTEPETILPKLAATVHMEVLESAMKGMQAMMPVLMQQLNQHTELNTKAKNLFTSINPDLADPQFEPAIMQLGQVYRNVNAKASPEEAARAIGNLVRSALGIAAPAVAAPAAPAVVPAAPVPFTPARGGGSGNAPIPASNAFTQLANEFLQDDY